MLNNRTESDARQYRIVEKKKKKKRKLGKVEQEIYNLLPFLLSCIVFPREYFRDTRACFSFEPLSLSKGLAAIKMAIRGQMEFLRNDYFGTVILRDPLHPKTSPWPAGSNYRAVSWHRFNFPAKYTGDVYLANCLFQACISVHVEVLQKHRGISIESNWGVGGIENIW